MNLASDAHGAGARRFVLVFALLWLLALAALSLHLWQQRQRPLLLVPALGGLHACLKLEHRPEKSDHLPPDCAGAQGSAAGLVEAQLSALGPAQSTDGRWQLGYTLVIPLLNLFVPDAAAEGGWAVDDEAVQRLARTVAQVERPVVLYLFSTHFSEHAPIEPALAADVRNLAVTSRGPLTVDRFLDAPMYPWSIARTDNGITARREQAIAAVTEAMCRLPTAARQRIVGLNLLGEVHHLYPDFEAGMGHDSDYVLTDYSAASRAGFRRWLAQRFGSIEALNRHLGSDFVGFDGIEPPARNIQREPLAHFWQHIDDAAAGKLAISGWVHDAARPAGDPARVRVYVDGVLQARLSAHFVRQDVLQAKPELGTARLGWRHDWRFDGLEPGMHRIDVVLEGANGRLQHMGTRQVAVMGRDQAAPQTRPLVKPLPPMDSLPGGVSQWVDAPEEGRAVFYNPLVPLWHAWRNQQVVDYLSHFDALLARSCLSDVPRRSQQIYPAEQAGWDASRFASAQSLRPFGAVQLGINLYGEATGDASFYNWLARSGQSGYSVTEFHPLQALSTAELDQLLKQHRRHGARSLSFFLHPVASGQTPANPFAFDPNNPEHGSDRLYQAMQQLLAPSGAGSNLP